MQDGNHGLHLILSSEGNVDNSKFFLEDLFDVLRGVDLEEDPHIDCDRATRKSQHITNFCHSNFATDPFLSFVIQHQGMILNLDAIDKIKVFLNVHHDITNAARDTVLIETGVPHCKVKKCAVWGV